MNPYQNTGHNLGGNNSDMESDDDWPDDNKPRPSKGKGKAGDGDGGEIKEKKGINRVNRACVSHISVGT